MFVNTYTVLFLEASSMAYTKTIVYSSYGDTLDLLLHPHEHKHLEKITTPQGPEPTGRRDELIPTPGANVGTS